MNKFNRYLLRRILQSELKNKNQSSVVTDIYFSVASYMVKNFNDFDGKRNHFFPILTDNRRKSFEEFITQCYVDCVNRVKISGPDKEI